MNKIILLRSEYDRLIEKHPVWMSGRFKLETQEWFVWGVRIDNPSPGLIHIVEGLKSRDQTPSP